MPVFRVVRAAPNGLASPRGDLLDCSRLQGDGFERKMSMVKAASKALQGAAIGETDPTFRPRRTVAAPSSADAWAARGFSSG
jgi:hypothetical protein